MKTPEAIAIRDKAERVIIDALVEHPGGATFNQLREVIDLEEQMQPVPLLLFLLELIKRNIVIETYVSNGTDARIPGYHRYQLAVDDWIVAAHKAD